MATATVETIHVRCTCGHTFYAHQIAVNTVKVDRRPCEVLGCPCRKFEEGK
jgi:hypothetical protein